VEETGKLRGAIRLWNGVVASAENSQQISDWYSNMACMFPWLTSA
jgi:hypothetical protein